MNLTCWCANTHMETAKTFHLLLLHQQQSLHEDINMASNMSHTLCTLPLEFRHQLYSLLLITCIEDDPQHKGKLLNQCPATFSLSRYPYLQMPIFLVNKQLHAEFMDFIQAEK